MQRVQTSFIHRTTEVVSLRMMETSRGLRTVAVAFLILIMLLGVILFYVPCQH